MIGMSTVKRFASNHVISTYIVEAFGLVTSVALI